MKKLPTFAAPYEIRKVLKAVTESEVDGVEWQMVLKNKFLERFGGMKKLPTFALPIEREGSKKF